MSIHRMDVGPRMSPDRWHYPPAPWRMDAAGSQPEGVRRTFRPFIKSECLSKLVLLGENHLRTLALEYVAHYHTERYPGLTKWLIELPANAGGPGRSSAASASAGSFASTTARRPERGSGRSGSLVGCECLRPRNRFHRRQGA
jgi:hypothetical protein